MIANELRSKHRIPSSPRPDSDDEDDDADGEEDGEDDDLELDDDVDSGSWNGIMSEVDDGTSSEHIVNVKSRVPAVKRQVRFAVPDSDSDSDSTTTETSNDINEMFPDIFVAQASLDPGFRREIEQDADDTSSVASYWDLHDSMSPPDVAAEKRLVEVLDNDDVESTPVPSPEDTQDLDGYDSDGDTTEEDIPEPSARRKQLHIRRVETAGSSDSDTDRLIKPRRGRPRSGHFDLDRADEKPIAVMHPVTRKLIIFTPEKTRGFDLSPESFRGLEGLFNSMAQSSPITRHSSQDIMMAPMLSNCSLPDILSSYPFGSIEAFLPSAGVNEVAEDDSDFSGEQVDEEEAMLNLDDFIEFEAHSSGDEDEAKEDNEDDVWDEAEAEAEEEDESPTTPCRRPSTSSVPDDAHMDLHPLLAHFENTTDVGAFRRNQINQQLILSGAASSESLAFSGPYMMGTLKGIKSDRLESATTSLSPVRRRKRSSVSMADAETVRSSLDAKRKASETLNSQAHKKHRSISDVRDIAL